MYLPTSKQPQLFLPELSKRRGLLLRRPLLLLVLLSVMGASPALRASTPPEPLKPIPAALPQNPARVAIGRLLFNDVRLSQNNLLSCASCHDLRNGGVDHRQRSPGFSGALTAVNTPTVFNAALNFKQFWDGRADSLEAQIETVVKNPVEMGSTWEGVMGKLSRDPAYPRAFAAAYPDGLNKHNVQDAIATFERTLTTPNSRFDKYLRGDRSAISAAEKAGYASFKQFGCVACHQGVNIGGNMFQKFGVMGSYFEQRSTPSTAADLGRFAVTGDAADMNVFKVPSLRNVANTAPYFHDGSAATLEQAVDVMFQFQLGRPAPQDDKQAIVLFLKTLNGEIASGP